MTEEEISNRKKEIIDELEKLTQEWVNVTDAEHDSQGGIVTASVLSFESSRFDDDGCQVFRTDYISLGPTSYVGTIGLLKESLWSVQQRAHGHCCHE